MKERIGLLALLIACFGCATMTSAIAFAQEDSDKPNEGIVIEPDAILGDEQVDPEDKLSLLVDKSSIANLDFLDAGDAPTSVDQLKAMQKHVASLFERVKPAVVNIQSGSGQGSGVVVTSDGYILTAAHVISTPNRRATITFPDGSKALAQTLGIHRSHDAGLLRIYRMLQNSSEQNSGDSSDDDQDSDSQQNPESKETEDDKDDDQSKEPDADGESSKESQSPSDADESEQSKKEEVEDQKESPSKPSDDPGAEDQEEASPEADDDSETNDSDKEQPSKKEDDSPDGSDKEQKPEAKEKRNSRFQIQDDLPSFDYLEIGDSAQLNLGQWVIAVGHPGGLDMDRGIVLRVGRINELDETTVQTDCTLVGGDSGGPLIGMDGSVIGIHSRIGARLKDNYHVPSNEYLDNWSELSEPIVLDGEPAAGFSVRGTSNVIQSISRRSFAARSGLKVSDRVIRIGDKEIYDKIQLDDAISNLKPYQEVEFEVQRKGKKMVLDVTIGENRSMMRFR